MKRIMLVFATTLLTVASTLGTPAFAAPEWYQAEVISVGMPTKGSMVIKLTHVAGPGPAFTNKWFSTTQIQVREMFATALTAMAAGLKVSVNADTVTNNLTLLYLRND